MKREYKKPQITFESFELNSNIAGACEKDITAILGVCAWTVYDEFGDTYNVFTSDVGACTTKPQDGSYNGFCYHVPTEDYNLFNS